MDWAHRHGVAQLGLHTFGSTTAAEVASPDAGTGQGAAGSAFGAAGTRARPETRQCTLEPPKPKLEMATVPPVQGVASATTWKTICMMVKPGCGLLRSYAAPKALPAHPAIWAMLAGNTIKLNVDNQSRHIAAVARIHRAAP